MTDSRKRNLYFVVLYIAFYYFWICFFKGNDGLLKAGGDLLQLLAPFISAVWLFKETKKRTGREKYFWFFFGVGNAFYFLGQFIWNYYELILHTKSPSPSMADAFFCLQYVAYFIALSFEIFHISNMRRAYKLLLDILIVMSVAVTLSWEFIITPAIWANLKISLPVTIFYTLNPIAHLGILFGILVITYVSEKTSSKSLSVFLALGIFLAVIANSYFMITALTGTYKTGSLVDPLWSLSLFLIGIAGQYSKPSDFVLPAKAGQLSNQQSSFVDYLYMGLPYITVPILFIVLLTRVRVDSIIIGLSISIGLLIVRQILTLLENEDYIQRYKKLTDELDVKVKERTEELEHLAYHDQLTGLPNRHYLTQFLNDTIHFAKQHQKTVAILLLDLDRFKQINDVLGHSLGDYLLIKMGERLVLCTDGKGKVFRLGGDEFTIILQDTSETEAEMIAAAVSKTVHQPLQIGEEEIRISTSIGISMYPCHGDNRDLLFKQADVAMYQAKKEGKNNHKFFKAEMDNRMSRQLTIERGLKTAIAENAFRLAFQPLVHMETGEIFGAEALLRWTHPVIGTVPPVDFIPIAEETGIIVEIGYWVMKTACREARKWHQAGYALKISINISVAQFKQADFVKNVRTIIDWTRIDPNLVQLEITESIAMLEAEMVVQRLKELRSAGIQISVDDFGTGYSSLSYLTKFPISTLKIDQSFIRDLGINKQVVSTIISLAGTLKADVIAEGVETPEQLNLLKQLGCHLAQGYLFGRPMFGEDFEAFLLRSKVRGFEFY